MPRIRIDLAYDGGSFCGWQLQKSDPTVQGVLESVLRDLTGEDTRVTGSGRTDSGVHALCQTAHFDTDSGIPPEKFAPALNSRLPRDVRILRSIRVGDDFHARYSARRRIYRYRIIPAAQLTPFNASRALVLRRRPDCHLLNRLASVLVGEHDFTVFAAAGDPSESKVRTLYGASFIPLRGELIFQISGNAFLWRMVRSIVGTLLETEERGQGPEQIRSLLAGRNRPLAGATAPPQALYLYKVLYDE
jgi:tRNA pseudouridine38-40 synthase